MWYSSIRIERSFGKIGKIHPGRSFPETLFSVKCHCGVDGRPNKENTLKCPYTGTWAQTWVCTWLGLPCCVDLTYLRFDCFETWVWLKLKAKVCSDSYGYDKLSLFRMHMANKHIDFTICHNQTGFGSLYVKSKIGKFPWQHVIQCIPVQHSHV